MKISGKGISMRSIKTKIVLVVLMCSLISTVICGSISIVESSRAVEENSRDKMELVCENQSRQLDGMMEQVAQSVDTLNDLAVSELEDFGQFKTDAKYVEAYTQRIAPMLKQTAVHTQGAMSVYIRYNPEFTEPTSGAFYTRDSADSEFQEIEPTDFSMYEPDDLEHVGWYYIPVQNQQPTWMEPYLNSNINVYMISYVIPIFVDGESVGIIGMDIDFSAFTQVLESCSVFQSGYAFLANEQGVIMHHKELENGSSMAEAGLEAVAANLALPDQEKVIQQYTWNGVKKNMCYISLVNGMRFILTAPAAEFAGQAKTMQMLILIGAAAALLVAAFVGFVLSISLTRPIRQINSIVGETAKFNFTHYASSESLYKKKDETASMAHSLHDMRDSLRGMVESIRQAYTDMASSMEQLAETTEKVNNMSEDNSATTQELAAAMQETADAMDMVNGTIANIRDRAEAIRGRSDAGMNDSVEIRGRAEKLKGSTRDASERTQEMYASVQEKTKEAMEQAKAVSHINELTQSILDISSQTNLLALNASIEAARAGEAGRGFAVVAGEIGALADQTSAAVGDINGIIAEVNHAVSNMTACLDESMEFLEDTVLRDYGDFMEVAEQYSIDAAGVEDNMGDINSQIETLLNAIVDMADAVERVSHTTMEAAEGITEIAGKTQEMSGVVGTNSDLIEHNQQNIEKLKEIVASFQMQ